MTIPLVFSFNRSSQYYYRLQTTDYRLQTTDYRLQTKASDILLFMKIGLVCPYNLFKGGGVQECVIAIQAELAKRGHEALIIAPQPKETPDEVADYIRLLGRALSYYCSGFCLCGSSRSRALA